MTPYELRHQKIYEITRDMLLAEKDLQRKSNAYWQAKDPTRKHQTSLMARKERAAEWFGKCEVEFEKYINEHIVNGVFHLTNTDAFMKMVKSRDFWTKA